MAFSDPSLKAQFKIGLKLIERAGISSIVSYLIIVICLVINSLIKSKIKMSNV